jgi:hypothetical protein
MDTSTKKFLKSLSFALLTYFAVVFAVAVIINVEVMLALILLKK